MANGYIGLVNIGGDLYKIGSTLYGVCSTQATTAIKEVVIEGYSQTAGVTAHIKFTYAHTDTAVTPQLKIKSSNDDSSATAYDIVNANGPKTWAAGSVISFTLTGTSATDYKWEINSSAIDASSVQNLSLGNITNNGTISGSDVTIQAGDKLVIVDANSSPAGQIVRSSLTFGSVTTQDQTTTFLRSDGTWAAPSYTTNTDEKVKQTPTTTSGEYELLFSESANNSQLTEGARKTSTLKYNPSTKTLTIDTATLTSTRYTGKADTAGTADNVPWSGVTSKPTTLSGYGITDALPSNSSFTIAGNTVDFSTHNDLAASTLRESLGLSQALRFVGTTTTTMSDGYTGTPAGISIYSGTSAVAPVLGDVVLDSSSDAEYVCVSVSGTTYTWERLGRDSSWALDNAVIHNSLLTTKGDIIYRNDTVPTRLPIGTGNNKFLTISSGVPAWGTVSKTDVGLSNVTNDAQIPKSIGTAKGDIIYFDGSASPKRLEISSTSGQVLTVSSTGIPEWADNQATDDKTKQSPVAQNATDANKEYAVLFKNTHSAWTEETAGVKFTSTNEYRVTINPSTGTLTAKKFAGDGSSLTNVTASSVAWANVTGKKFAKIYVNTTSAGTNSNVATSNSNTYIHLYDNDAIQDTLKFIGAGGTTIAADANKVITITSKEYTSSGTAQAFTSITLSNTGNTSEATQAIGDTAIALGYVKTGILYIKSIQRATTSVSTGVSVVNS